MKTDGRSLKSGNVFHFLGNTLGFYRSSLNLQLPFELLKLDNNNGVTGPYADVRVWHRNCRFHIIYRCIIAALPTLALGVKENNHH